MEKYTLLKIFVMVTDVKVLDEKIIGKASKGEVWVYFFRKNRADIDPGILEVSIALTALFAVIVVQPIDILIRTYSGNLFCSKLLGSSYTLWDIYFA